MVRVVSEIKKTFLQNSSPSSNYIGRLPVEFMVCSSKMLLIIMSSLWYFLQHVNSMKTTPVF